MTVTDILNYVVFTNPLSANAGSIAKSTASILANYSGLSPRTDYKMIPSQPLWKLASQCGGLYIKLAGLSGATAVIIGSYGAHRGYSDDNLKLVFETANKYHFYHSLAMISLVFCKRPKLTATLWLSGTLLFSGNAYYYAFTGDKRANRLLPVGGMCFILGWLTLCI